MPSSPSTTPTNQETRSPVQIQDLQKYRQTVYHDGTGRHIAESRRRCRMVRKLETTTIVSLDWVLYPKDNAFPSPHIRSVDLSPNCPSSISSSGVTRAATHVTHAKRPSKASSKAIVIIDARQTIETGTDETKSPIQRPVALTPPPTPRMERLPTPDWPDLDEAPFCDCGVEAHIVKFCTSCNKEFDCRSK